MCQHEIVTTQWSPLNPHSLEVFCLECSKVVDEIDMSDSPAEPFHVWMESMESNERDYITQEATQEPW